MKKRNIHLTCLKLGIIIVMITVFSFYPTFAADKCSGSVADTLERINVFFGNAGRFCSWIRILLGNFAGVLMTNTMVYGEFMGLDSFLWKIWQISRSMANYALGVMFIYSIFKYIFFQKQESWSKIIRNMLVTSVLIQSSWFLVMALVDLSTIALATVSAFPSQVISVIPDLKTEMKKQLCKNPVLGQEKKKVVVINAFSDKVIEQDNTRWFLGADSSSSTTDSQDCDPSTKLIDSVLPQADSLGGPFVYLGFTALNAQDYVYKTVPTSSNCVDDIVKTVINLILDAGMLLLYSIALVIFIILLIMRLGYLWVFIAISPIVIFVGFSGFLNMSSKGIGELFDFKKALFLIFQPVIFGLWMSLMFLFVIVIQGLFTSSASSSMGGSVSVTESKNSSTQTDPLPKITSSIGNSGIVDLSIKQGSKSLKDILLSLIVLVLMWQLVKMAVSGQFMGFQGLNTIKGKMDKITGSIGTAFSSAKVIPLPGGESVGLREVTNGNLYNTVKDKVIKEKYKDYYKYFEYDRRRNKQGNAINKYFGLDNTISYLDSSQESDLKNAVSSNNITDLPNKLKQIKEDNDGLRFSGVQSYINKWVIKNRGNEEGLGQYFAGEQVKVIINADKEFDVDKLFKESNNHDGFRKFYTNVLGGKSADDLTYSDFINKYKGEVR